jgi:hypothetical protein
MNQALAAGARAAHSRAEFAASGLPGLGWTLDGMDSFIFALVLAPALTELLPKSGMSGSAEPGGVRRVGAVRRISGGLG